MIGIRYSKLIKDLSNERIEENINIWNDYLSREHLMSYDYNIKKEDIIIFLRELTIELLEREI